MNNTIEAIKRDVNQKVIAYPFREAKLDSLYISINDLFEILDKYEGKLQKQIDKLIEKYTKEIIELNGIGENSKLNIIDTTIDTCYEIVMDLKKLKGE